MKRCARLLSICCRGHCEDNDAASERYPAVLANVVTDVAATAVDAVNAVNAADVQDGSCCNEDKW